jgi:hypothetical protein
VALANQLDYLRHVMEVGKFWALELDQTAAEYVKYTSATYRGVDIGGFSGADTKCNNAYSGYHFCTETEITTAARTGCLPEAGSYGFTFNLTGWAGTGCSNWTTSTGIGYALQPYTSTLSVWWFSNADPSNGSQYTCGTPRALACCK